MNYFTSQNARASNRCHASAKAKQNNLMIRDCLAKHNMKQWQLAALLGMREDVFSKTLRFELSEEQQKEICAVIEKAAHDGTD